MCLKTIPQDSITWQKSLSTNQYHYAENQSTKRKTRLMLWVHSSLVVVTKLRPTLIQRSEHYQQDFLSPVLLDSWLRTNNPSTSLITIQKTRNKKCWVPYISAMEYWGTLTHLQQVYPSAALAETSLPFSGGQKEGRRINWWDRPSSPNLAAKYHSSTRN